MPQCQYFIMIFISLFAHNVRYIVLYPTRICLSKSWPLYSGCFFVDSILKLLNRIFNPFSFLVHLNCHLDLIEKKKTTTNLKNRKSLVRGERRDKRWMLMTVTQMLTQMMVWKYLERKLIILELFRS
jgi:hypothetical protein